MSAALALTESVQKIAQVLRERPPQHWLLNRATSDIDQLGTQLHALAIRHSPEIAECLAGALGELAGAHALPEERRPDATVRAIEHLEAALGWLATSAQAAPIRVVLIVERDETVRSLQRSFLERVGLAVEFADDGEEAFERVRRDPPALVVTEILVPRLDGLALCRRLRDDPQTQAIPVMVFSILSAGQRAGEAGASAFLRKPLVDTTFVAAVQELITAQPISDLEQTWPSR